MILHDNIVFVTYWCLMMILLLEDYFAVAVAVAVLVAVVGKEGHLVSK